MKNMAVLFSTSRHKIICKENDFLAVAGRESFSSYLFYIIITFLHHFAVEVSLKDVSLCISNSWDEKFSSELHFT